MAGELDLGQLGSGFSNILQASGPALMLIAFVVVAGLLILLLVYLYLKGYFLTKYPNFAGVFEYVGTSVIFTPTQARKIKDKEGHEEYQLKSTKEMVQKFSYENLTACSNGKKAIFMVKLSDTEAYPVVFKMGTDEKGNKIGNLIPLLTGSDVNAYIDRLWRNHERFHKQTDLEKYWGLIAMLIFGVFLLLMMLIFMWKIGDISTVMTATKDATENLYRMELLRHGGNGTIIGG